MPTTLREANAALARRYREELWDGKLEAAGEVIDRSGLLHAADPITTDFGPGPEGSKQLVEMYRAAFPDAEFIVEDLVVEESKVTARWTGRGTHQGALGDIAPTGRRVNVSGADIHHIGDGKIKETWTSWDALGMLRQLGVSG